MDFGLSEDQLLLEKTLRSFLAKEVSISRVRDLREAECPNDVGIWRSLAELGVTGRWDIVEECCAHQRL